MTITEAWAAATNPPTGITGASGRFNRFFNNSLSFATSIRLRAIMSLAILSIFRCIGFLSDGEGGEGDEGGDDVEGGGGDGGGGAATSVAAAALDSVCRTTLYTINTTYEIYKKKLKTLLQVILTELIFLN